MLTVPPFSLPCTQGKILHKPELVEKGHDRKTGALEEKEKAKDDAEDVSTLYLKPSHVVY